MVMKTQSAAPRALVYYVSENESPTRSGKTSLSIERFSYSRGQFRQASAVDDKSAGLKVRVLKLAKNIRAAQLQRQLTESRGLADQILLVMEANEFNTPEINYVVKDHSTFVYVSDQESFQLEQLGPWFKHLLGKSQPRTSTPALEPLDVSARLRDPVTGRLDARLIVELLGLKLSDLAGLCDVSKQNLSQNPTSSGIQESLRPFEQIAQYLRWCQGSEAKLRAWLNTPNDDFPQVKGKTLSPLDLILMGHPEIVAERVSNLRAGQPA